MGRDIAAAEDASRKALKRASAHEHDGASPTTDKESKDLEKEVKGVLDQARKAKNEAYGAAAAGKKAKDARPDIEAAEKSFDEAEDHIDKGSKEKQPAPRNKEFKKAAEKIVEDLKKVKDAMDKVTA